MRDLFLTFVYAFVTSISIGIGLSIAGLITYVAFIYIEYLVGKLEDRLYNNEEK